MKKKSLKKLLAAVLGAGMIMSLAACGSSSGSAGSAAPAASAASAGTEASGEGDLLARIKAKGSISIATEGDWSPWNYHDENDTLTGLDVEIGQSIADYLGVKADFQETDWDSILAGVDSGRFDIACNGVSYTDERAEKYTFTDPYVYTHMVLVVREDNQDIKSLEDLTGKTTANTASSIYAEIAEQHGATVTPVNTLLETIELVNQGRVDATINAQESIEDYLKQHPDSGIKIVAVLEGDTVVIPLRKDPDTDSLQKEINACLQEMRDNGKLAEISIKYFGIDMTNKQ